MTTETPVSPEVEAEPAVQQFAPNKIFNRLNGFMRALLRSPLHGMVSKQLMLITFTGRKSGREFTTPVTYIRDGGEVVFFTSHAWLKNLPDNPRVTLRLRGRDVPARARVFSEGSDVAEGALRFLRRKGVKSAWQIGLKLDTSHEPDFNEVLKAVNGTVMVRLRGTSWPKS